MKLKKVLFLLFICIVFFSAIALPAFELPKDGKNSIELIIGKQPMMSQELLAVKELCEYLKKVANVDIKKVPIGKERPDGKHIFLNYAAVEKLGLKKPFSDQEFLVKITSNNIFLAGGERDGLSNAVYYFLEHCVGVRWWNKTEEFIPRNPLLKLKNMVVRKTPDFRLRSVEGMRKMAAKRFGYDYLYGIDSAGKEIKFKNFRDRAIPENHNLIRYYAGIENFKTHPEWYAEVGGKRTLKANDLCLTNPMVAEHVAVQVMKKIAADRKECKKSGMPFPFVYSISREDNARWCQCAMCQIYKMKHGRSGTIVNFVNNIAKKIKNKYPDVLISTLAYQGAASAPKGVKPADNVAIVYCFEKRNIARSLTDKSNRVTLKELKAWAKISKNLFIWDYAMSFGGYHGSLYDHDFVVPSMLHMAQDHKLCKELGVSGIFVQNASNEKRDLWGLKNWMLSKLYFDSSLDNEELISTYLKGYYGPAWKDIRRYMQVLYDADQRKPSNIWFYADLTEYKYLDLKFFRDAEKAFDAAEKSVETDSLYLDRVKATRFATDRALLYRWSILLRNWRLQSKSVNSFPFNRNKILKRVDDGFKLICKLNPCGRTKNIHPSYANGSFRRLKNMTSPQLPLPQKFKTVLRKNLYDFPAGSYYYTISKPVKCSSKGYIVSQDTFKLPFKWSFKPRWGAVQWEFKAGSDKTGKITASSIKKNGPHWYKLGRYYFDGTCTGLQFFNGKLKLWVDLVGKYDAWGQIDFSNNSICLSRVVLIKPKMGIKGNLKLPDKIFVFAPFVRGDNLNTSQLKRIPESIKIGNKSATAKHIIMKKRIADLAGELNGTADGRTAFIYIPFYNKKAQEVTLGFGADWWFAAWLDGKQICSTLSAGNGCWPLSPKNHMCNVKLSKGRHLLVIKFVSGSNSSTLTCAGPNQIRKFKPKEL